MTKLTKLAIANSFRKLAETESIDKITVSDIVADCGVTRQTFYYHFQNIASLVIWIYENEMPEMSKASGETYTWREGFLHIFNWAKKNYAFIKSTFDSFCQDYLLHFVTDDISRRLTDAFRQSKELVSLSESEKKFVINFYTFAFAGIFFDWMDNKMQEDPNDIFSKFDSISKVNIINTINMSKIKSVK